MPSKGRRETLGCNPTQESERDLTHVKHDAIGQALDLFGQSNGAQAQAALRMAISVHNAAVDGCIEVLDGRRKQWETQIGDENRDQRLARTMVHELATLAGLLNHLRAP